VSIALDATYSVGQGLSGVGVYSRELLNGLAAAHPEERFDWCYRPHRFLRALRAEAPRNVRRRPLLDAVPFSSARLFHGLNQRLPRTRFQRTIATFHDLFVMTGDYSTLEFRQRFTEQARQAAERADAIIAVSAFTGRQVTALLNVEPQRVHVVHHGIRALPAPAVAREKVILNVGAVQVRKNIARLVEAFESVDPDWRLVLAGSAGFGSESILQRIAASPARDRIQVLGYVTPRELAEWYARAMVFAFPSLDEGFGMPVLEAMAAGVPVLTSNQSATLEVAGNAASLVNPSDVVQIANNLQELTRDEGLRRNLAELGLERAHEFSWERAARETWAVYAELLG
jgi:glycosyltransferase involved in cell wall biosynthesis